MNYERIYDELISHAKNRGIPDDYYEKHHIVPKCLGGNNQPDNIVKLTAREHFIAHKLLFKFTIGPNKSKMGYALHKMLFPNNKNQIQRCVSSRAYEELKKIYNYIRGEQHPMYGRKFDDEFRKKCSLNKMGEKNPMYGKKTWNSGKTKEFDSRLEVSEEVRKKLSIANMGRIHTENTKKLISKTHLGKPKSEDHKQKISQTLKGHKLSEETKEKMSFSRKGKSQNKISCPYCGKVGGTAMYRWHFNNCKNKNEYETGNSLEK
jgi:hypothetical protein